jgi:seryl-tRNA synthetase
VIRKWGTPGPAGRAHDDLAVALGMYDPERAAKISGSRFYVLSGALAAMERALIQFFLDVHVAEHGYREVLVPYIVRRSALVGTTQLPKFEGDLFKVTTQLAGEDAFLIPTAEVPVTNLHQDEILEESALPVKYCAFTPCFRSEAGAAGRDTRGLIRVHQFHKVEVVHIVRPEDSPAALEAITGHAEACLQRLGLPYQVVARCAGDVGFGGARGYDLEVWLPGQQAYREISSCTNFHDFQARRLKLRFKREGDKKTTFLHTLNGSALAVGRTLVAILENYQQADGSILVPEALRPYMRGLDRIEVPL